MAKYCTTCGAELNKTYKFCPECGAGISQKNIDDYQRSEPQKIDKQNRDYHVIICDNCGDENQPDNSICEGCGASLKGGLVKKIQSETPKKIPHKSEQKKDHISPRSTKRKQNPESKQVSKKEVKDFDAKKIYLIAAVIIIFVFVVLSSTGVFDTEQPTDLNVGNNQTNNSGVDLASLERINDLETKLNANPDDLDLLLELAHLKNDSGFYENAITLYQRYLAKNPVNADARIDMGVCYFNLRNYEAAIKEMKKALEYQPNHQIGHLNIGIVNLTAGNLEEAKVWFNKTIELGPETEIGKRAKELLNSHTL